MKSKHDAIKEFNRAFNRYWRGDRINMQCEKYCSNADFLLLDAKLRNKWNKLIELNVNLSKLEIELGNHFQPYEFDNDWSSLSFTRQIEYFMKFPGRKDFWFLRSKTK